MTDEQRRARADWLWNVFQRGGEGVTDAELDENLAPDAQYSMFRTAADVQRIAGQHVLRGSELIGTRKTDGAVVHDSRTRSGLQVEFTTLFTPEDRILQWGVRLVGGASQTAIGSAGLRAAHRRHDVPVVLDDRLAEQLAGEFAAPVIVAVGADRDNAPMRWLMVLRSRFAEETMIEAHRAHGIDQCVLLGAGLDSFAYRNTMDDLTVFEVDLPASQAWKRERLEACGITVPGNVRFAPCDFETDDFVDRLTDVGFRTDRPAVVFWLGVVWYLTQDAIDATISRIGAWPAPTTVVLDHVVPRTQWGDAGADLEAQAQALERNTTLNGEPWVTLDDQRAVRTMLEAAGFDRVDTYTWREMGELYIDPDDLPRMLPCFGLARGRRTS